MRFLQDKSTGSCDLEFNEDEIKIINNRKKLHFTPESLNKFGNTLMKIVVDWNMNFNTELQKKLNHENETLDLSKNDKSRE